jgi:hypothetical protein
MLRLETVLVEDHRFNSTTKVKLGLFWYGKGDSVSTLFMIPWFERCRRGIEE